MPKTYRYMLRYQLIPGEKEPERIAELAAFCRRNRIEEVMFFIAAEEFNTGHCTREETRVWVDTIGRAKKALDRQGVVTSLNPWITLLHADRGRTLKPGQNFQLMMDARGNSASAQVCPLCPEWRKYITETYRLLSTLKPGLIWIEDDFRYHNHRPLEWGGCFCPLHLEEMAKRAGEPVEREALFRNILQPGRPHPWRKIWLDLLHDGLVSLAGLLENAVHSVSPRTHLALMVSDPRVHCAEGRRWPELLAALSGPGRTPIIRPHIPYREYAGMFLHEFAFNRHTIACAPAGVRTCPELENFPYTRYAKSARLSRVQLAMTALEGSRDCTLNLYDFLGNGLAAEPDYAELLRASKPWLNALAALDIGRARPGGVCSVFRTDVSYHVATGAGRKMDELYCPDRGGAVHLSALGVSYYFSEKKPGRVNLVCGMQVQSMSREEILALLGTGVLLDGAAAAWLAQNGYGPYLGLREARWMHQNETPFSYEEGANPDFLEPGRRMTAQAFTAGSATTEFTPGGQGSAAWSSTADRMVQFSLAEGAVPVSKVFTPQKQECGVGVYVYQNALGGRVAAVGYYIPDSLDVCFLGYNRQRMMQSVLRWLSDGKERLFFVEDQPHMYVKRLDFPRRGLLAVIHTTADPIAGMTAYLENFPYDPDRCSYLSRDGKWMKFGRHLRVLAKNGRVLRLGIKYPLDYLDFLILKFDK
jgi:hypothetical protein